MKKTTAINRRDFCGSAAATVAVGSLGLSVLASERSHAMNAVFNEGRRCTAIRPFQVEFSGCGARRSAQAHQRDTTGPTRKRSPMHRRACSSRRSRSSRATGRRNTTGASARRGSTPLPQVHHRDRRARHPLHPRPFEARERAAGHRHARLAGLGRRAAEDHRSAHQSDGAWRHARRTPSTS